MRKGRKRTKGLARPEVFKPPTPEEQRTSAAEHAIETAIRTHPRFKTAARNLAEALHRGTGKIMRQIAKGDTKSSE